MRVMLEQVKDSLESILCLCAEGPEVMDKLPLIEAIKADAMTAWKICDEVLKED